MKKLLPFIFSAISVLATAQTASSIANGNWTNPLIWNCTCVPTTGYSVTISNNVTLNTSMVFNTGGVTINNTGSLIQDASLNRDIWINGGYFTNNGNANFRYFLVSAGSLGNAGNMTLTAMTNSVAYTNSGSITMDSMYVAGNLTNTANAKIIGDSLTNGPGVTFTNYGRVNVTWSTNLGNFINNNYHSGYAFTNAGTYNNNDSLILTGSTWNKARFYNNASGKVRLTKNFHNYTPGKTAAYINSGNVTVLDSWYNTDTVRGPSSGYFQVQDTTANSGFMKGSFTICDLTPTAPKVDFNSGTIDPTVMGCSLGITENELSTFAIYPNPSNGAVYFISESKNDFKLSVLDVTGKIILEKNIKANDEIIMNQPSGIYFLKITDTESGKSVNRKLIIRN